MGQQADPNAQGAGSDSSAKEESDKQKMNSLPSNPDSVMDKAAEEKTSKTVS